ncbi:hypothetical protein ACFY0R_10095 [Streptomyces sp. NPDC001633]|uniref:hypothetical protein n=1 Tax=Streptomyces sp. NPDC001633 TaxID=3364595 RepID=UPI00368DB513
MATDDPWATSTVPAATAPWEVYEDALDAAGYGAAARARYIASAADPEYAECEWDNNVIPAAEAAGIIPEPPSYEPTVEEQVREWCSRAAGRQFDATHGAPAPWDLTQQDVDTIKADTERLIVERGAELAAFLQANPRGAEEPAGAYDDRVFALLAEEPTAFVLPGSIRFMADELHNAWHPAHVAHLLDQLTAPDQGPITQLHDLITDAGHWALGLPDGEGRLLYAELLHAAARLESVRVQIAAQAGALVRFSALAPAQTAQAASRPTPVITAPASPQVPVRTPHSSKGQRR